ncbi:DUF6717 family protein [Daejeonella sp.]|jgi:hypothetical protein|uniref:DUF6717 family protein n=1 Tax=Daejeonella sp. TaxID=2805397 RepID=UPI0037C0C447
MQIKKRFYQEEDGRWYIDLPEYNESGVGTKSNLEMVAGADTFLSRLAEGKTTITLKFEDEPFEGHTINIIRSSDDGYTPELTDDMELDSGGWYHYYDKKKWYQLKPTCHTLWLCSVTLYLFNYTYPKNIFIQII